MRLQLEPAPTSPAEARRFVRRALQTNGVTEPIDLTELLTSELVTNAVLYSQGPIELSVSTGDGEVLVAVADCSPALPRPRPLDVRSTSGRGLQLVEQLADDWGVETNGSRKQVWFCLGREAASAR